MIDSWYVSKIEYILYFPYFHPFFLLKLRVKTEMFTFFFLIQIPFFFLHSLAPRLNILIQMIIKYFKHLISLN